MRVVVRTNIRRRAVALVAFGLAIASLATRPPEVRAATRVGSFAVTTSVVYGCSIDVQNMVFPTYITNQATIDNGTSSFTILCSGASSGSSVPVTYTVNAPGGFVMHQGATALNYRLCFDSACKNVIQNGKGNAILVTNTNYTLPYYGQIAAKQNVRVGPYNQTVGVTLSF